MVTSSKWLKLSTSAKISWDKPLSYNLSLVTEKKLSISFLFPSIDLRSCFLSFSSWVRVANSFSRLIFWLFNFSIFSSATKNLLYPSFLDAKSSSCVAIESKSFSIFCLSSSNCWILVTDFSKSKYNGNFLTNFSNLTICSSAFFISSKLSWSALLSFSRESNLFFSASKLLLKLSKISFSLSILVFSFCFSAFISLTSSICFSKASPFSLRLSNNAFLWLYSSFNSSDENNLPLSSDWAFS